LRYFCSPYRQDSALFPFIDQFGRASGSAPNDPPASRLEKFEALLARTGTPDECRRDARLAETGFTRDQHDVALLGLGLRPAP
jgi:hypothetical protein